MSVALICLVVSVIVAFGFRTVFQYVKTKDFGLRISRDRSSSTETRVVYVQLFVWLGILLMTVMESLGSIGTQIELGITGTILGVGLWLLGLVIVVTAQIQMGRAWRIGVDESEKTELVTHGMFRYSRNPIYAGVILIALSMLILVPHVAMCLFVAIGYGGIEMQVRLVEEPYLRKTHGNEYIDYCKQVNRYLPIPNVA